MCRQDVVSAGSCRYDPTIKDRTIVARAENEFETISSAADSSRDIEFVAMYDIAISGSVMLITPLC